MSNIYQKQMLEHAKNPKNNTRLKSPSVVSDNSNPSCGDKIVLDLKFNNSDVLTELGFDAEGCAVSRASASILGEHILGMSYNELVEFSVEDFWGILGLELSPTRQRCALVSYNALKGALGKYKS